MKDEHMPWVVFYMTIISIGAALIIYKGKNGWSEFLNTKEFWWILIVTISILAIGSIILGTSFWAYHPEKHMHRLQRKTGYSIKGICYFMCLNANVLLVHLRLTIVAMGILLFTPLNSLPYQNLLWIVIILLTNIGIVIYYRESRYKDLLENTKYYCQVSEEALVEDLSASLKKGLHFKESHLVITEDYIIGNNLAVPKNQIEELQLIECEPVRSYSAFMQNREVDTLRLRCELINGKSIDINLGSDAIEHSHIKKFGEYYSGIDSKLNGKYKGLRKRIRLQDIKRKLK